MESKFEGTVTYLQLVGYTLEEGETKSNGVATRSLRRPPYMSTIYKQTSIDDK